MKLIKNRFLKFFIIIFTITSIIASDRVFSSLSNSQSSYSSYQELPCRVEAILVANNYAYMATSNGLAVIDVTKPMNPGTPQYFETNQSCRDLWIQDDLIFVSEQNSWFAVFNISDPRSPVKIFEQRIFAGRSSHKKLFIFDNFIFAFDLSVLGSYLSIFNITYPINLELINEIPLQHAVNDIFVEGQYAYITVEDQSKSKFGLFLINISDPLNLSDPDFIGLGIPVNKVFMIGKYVYVTVSRENAFYIATINVSDPSNPIVDPLYQLRSWSRSYFVENNRVYIGTSGLELIEISDPPNLKEIPFLFLEKRVSIPDIFVAGNFAYVLQEEPENQCSLVCIDLTTAIEHYAKEATKREELHALELIVFISFLIFSILSIAYIATSQKRKKKGWLIGLYLWLYSRLPVHFWGRGKVRYTVFFGTFLLLFLYAAHLYTIEYFSFLITPQEPHKSFVMHRASFLSTFGIVITIFTFLFIFFEMIHSPRYLYTALGIGSGYLGIIWIPDLLNYLWQFSRQPRMSIIAFMSSRELAWNTVVNTYYTFIQSTILSLFTVILLIGSLVNYEQLKNNDTRRNLQFRLTGLLSIKEIFQNKPAGSVVWSLENKKASHLSKREINWLLELKLPNSWFTKEGNLRTTPALLKHLDQVIAKRQRQIQQKERKYTIQRITNELRTKTVPISVVKSQLKIDSIKEVIKIFNEKIPRIAEKDEYLSYIDQDQITFRNLNYYCNRCEREFENGSYHQCLSCHTSLCQEDYKNLEMQTEEKATCSICDGPLQVFPFQCKGCHITFLQWGSWFEKNRCPLCADEIRTANNK